MAVVGWLVEMSIGWLRCWLAVVGCLTDQDAGWLVEMLVGCGWLVG